MWWCPLGRRAHAGAPRRAGRDRCDRRSRCIASPGRRACRPATSWSPTADRSRPVRSATRTDPRCSRWSQRAVSNRVDLGLARRRRGRHRRGDRAGRGHLRCLDHQRRREHGRLRLREGVLGRSADMRWMQIAIRPAKPLAFGVVERAGHVGRPGVRAARQPRVVAGVVRVAGPSRPETDGGPLFDLERPRVRAVVDAALPRRPDGKTHFARVVCAVRRRRSIPRAFGGRAGLAPVGRHGRG